MAFVKKRKFPIEFSRRVFPKNIQWSIDFDYLYGLPREVQEFMAKFIREYYNANVGKASRGRLHNTKALRRDCYTRKNAQNRDLMSILNSGGKIDRLDDTQAETSHAVKNAFSNLSSRQRRKK